jgi:hypothetical protein
MKSRKILLKKNGMNNAQTFAVKLSKSIGAKLALSHPEIAAEWLAGATEKELGMRYCPTDSVAVARNAVHYALKDLLPQEEIRADVARKHIMRALVKNGKAAAARQLRDRTGVWAMSPDKRRKASQKGGRMGGRKMGKRNYRLGLGFAKLTTEQLSKQGKSLAIANGFILYDNGVSMTEFGMSNEKDYIVKLKASNGLSWIDITSQVNNVFGNNRKMVSIRTLYNQRWKTATPQPSTV